EIYPIDTWREERRFSSFDPIIPGSKPPGHAKRKRKDLPKSISQILPLGIFVSVILGVISWWGIDLIILATATGGLAIGIGLALQETMQNYFAYILIRKDKIFSEGERIQLDSGYNGYVHKITPRVTFIRDALNESFAIIPTRQLVTAQIINYSKELKMVPAVVEVGVSYLNNPKQVAGILVKIGKRAMEEVLDDRGRHMVVQHRCPYLNQNKPSCGCDKDIHVDLNQPVVRFNKFNDSSLDFSLWVFVRDYGAQFKIKTGIRMIMYEEFKKYDIRIPWPIRTVYQGDEKREDEEIRKLDGERNRVIDEFGLGDLGRGGAAEE
ncbi:MAG: mechanosensitive ion channel, partial [Nitrosopumilus sp.]|nr:mechanosensitive ion channel [Nitrosopumilus sp.]